MVVFKLVLSDAVGGSPADISNVTDAETVSTGVGNSVGIAVGGINGTAVGDKTGAGIGKIDGSGLGIIGVGPNVGPPVG
jgi:hypothetical protein